ncbi:hypothetical protein [Oceanobacillus sp. 1P07AA]|uniref:hypothetical protein n=1 Tax=Oceanobacillus sp. 1P07AA TaxID=3132293 RepID=UPI0039A6A000
MHYLAITYDICEHNHFVEEMNEYRLEPRVEIKQQLMNLAKKDVAPLIKVYQSITSDFKEVTLYQEYTFKEYECGCYSIKV